MITPENEEEISVKMGTVEYERTEALRGPAAIGLHQRCIDEICNTLNSETIREPDAVAKHLESIYRSETDDGETRDRALEALHAEWARG